MGWLLVELTSVGGADCLAVTVKLNGILHCIVDIVQRKMNTITVVT